MVYNSLSLFEHWARPKVNIQQGWFVSAEGQIFLTRFRIRHQVSSAYNPHNNQRAEGALKAARRMIRESTGSLDTDKLLATLLMHQSKPDPATVLSSSEVVYRRKIKKTPAQRPRETESASWVAQSHDRLPAHPGKEPLEEQPRTKRALLQAGAAQGRHHGRCQ